MLETIVHEVVGPVARRFGTLVGGALSGYGLAADDITAVAAGVVALIGIGCDLLVVYVRHRTLKGGRK